MTNAMTSHERVECSLSWREPDRVPIQTYLTPEMRARLADHFGTEDFLDRLGVDFRRVEPRYVGRPRPSEGDVHFDMWGAGFRRVAHGQAGSYDEAVVLPLAELETLDDVEAFPWPDPERDFDYSVIPEQCERFKNHARLLGGAGYPDIVNGVARGRGMERVMLDIAMRDEVGLAIIDKRVDICREILRRGLEAAGGEVDILHLGEDTGNQRGRMVSPADFDEVFRPRLEAFFRMAHDYGARAMMHSCGDTHDLMPTFIDMGLDVLDAMQPEPPGMDPETIRAACRGRLAFCGLISTQRTLPFGTEAECRAEARHRLDVIAPGGGYIFSPAHCIQPDTPLENMLAIYEEAMRTGLKAG